MPESTSPSISPQAVRDFLRQAAELGTWTTKDASRFLAIGANEAKRALSTLQTVGYVEAVPRSKDQWRNTEAGNAMAQVSAARPIKRETAADKLDEFAERCGHVNRDPHYLFRVKRAVVYGPYLTKTAKLKNVDIAVELEPKEKNKAKHDERMRGRAAEAESAGKRFSSYRAKREWGRREVLDFLKSRARAINLVEMADWILAEPHEDLL